MAGMRIRWRGVARVGAIVLIAVIALRLVPGLLRTPEPPPVPADVGLPKAAAGTPPSIVPPRAEAKKRARRSVPRRRRGSAGESRPASRGEASAASAVIGTRARRRGGHRQAGRVPASTRADKRRRPGPAPSRATRGPKPPEPAPSRADRGPKPPPAPARPRRARDPKPSQSPEPSPQPIESTPPPTLESPPPPVPAPPPPPLPEPPPAIEPTPGDGSEEFAPH